MITQEINAVFTKHCTIVDNFITLNDNAEELKNEESEQIYTKSDTTKAKQRELSF